ncbi:hypothetical protein K239x_04550 [Planctomycetes bacterium K23_9]|uniref:Uncharacterized protein n=2 Tax=Stieleria marina TaxID=1930275 RepID=A0A517NN07_9BACT|nr:hypothetical protein K239x_04550 [Planctomycetes bacterium K23_9]
MVLLGFGSCLLFFCAADSHADMPVSIREQASTAEQTPVAWHTSLQSGWREAKRRGVPMVIYITTQDCVYCDAMKQNTWCNQSVQQRLAGKFVAIRLNKLRNRQTLSRISVDTFPTTLLGTPNGKVIGHRVGYQPPEALQSFLAEANRNRVTKAPGIQAVH